MGLGILSREDLQNLVETLGFKPAIKAVLAKKKLTLRQLANSAKPPIPEATMSHILGGRDDCQGHRGGDIIARAVLDDKTATWQDLKALADGD